MVEERLATNPVPPAFDESGSFTYTTGYGTSETDISALFTTPLTGTTRRGYFVWLYIKAMQDDGAAWTKLTVRIKTRVGTIYGPADTKEISKTDDPVIPVEIPATARDVQITFQLDVTLSQNRVVDYSYVEEILEP